MGGDAGAAQEPTEDARLEARVTGRVQGVGFRAFTRREAAELRLNGYVRNLGDGSVEVVAEGRRSALERLLGALRRGPCLAEVANVTTVWSAPTGDYIGFGFRAHQTERMNLDAPPLAPDDTPTTHDSGQDREDGSP